MERTLAPMGGAYHGEYPETSGMSRAPTTNLLSAPAPGELPDTRLTKAARRRCKHLAKQAAETLNLDGLMFLAAAVEVEAAKKHDEIHGRRA